MDGSESESESLDNKAAVLADLLEGNAAIFVV